LMDTAAAPRHRCRAVGPQCRRLSVRTFRSLGPTACPTSAPRGNVPTAVDSSRGGCPSASRVRRNEVPAVPITAVRTTLATATAARHLASQPVLELSAPRLPPGILAPA
jgi:hypothetical protein